EQMTALIAGQHRQRLDLPQSPHRDADGILIAIQEQVAGPAGHRPTDDFIRRVLRLQAVEWSQFTLAGWRGVHALVLEGKVMMISAPGGGGCPTAMVPP